MGVIILKVAGRNVAPSDIYQFGCPTKSKMTEKAYGLKVCVDSISGSFLISRFCLTTLPQLDNYATPEVDEEEDVIQGGDEDDHVK